jgi:hypothetical protein
MKAATLELDFVTNLAKLQGELSQIKRAVTQTMGEAVSSYNQLVRSADGMAASLERQAATHGKTAEQIRQMDVAAKALALEEAGLTAKADRLRAAEQALQAVQVKGHAVTGQSRAGMQQLSFQLNDVATSFQGGIAPMTIFAQQGSQVVQAIQLMAGESKGFIGFIAGPWGAILTAATVVLAPFVAKLFEGAKASDDATKAYATLTDATKALDEATGRAHKSKEQEIEDSVRATKAKLAEAIANRQVLASRLQGFQQGIDAPIGGTVGGGAQFAAAASAQITAAAIAANTKAIAEAEKSLRSAGFIDIQNNVAAATDKVTAARQRLAHMTEVLGAAVTAGTISESEATRQLTLQTNALKAVEDADKNAAAAARAHKHELSEQAKAARQAAAAAKKLAETQAHFTGDADFAFAKQVRELMDSLSVKDLTPNLRESSQAIGEIVDGLRAADEYAAKLKLDEAAASAERMRDAAQSMAQAWGSVGEAVGKALTVLANYGEQEAAINAKSITDREKQKQLSNLQLTSLIDLTDAGKHLFNENSKGYKAMAAAEKALTIIQLARTAVDVAGGAARMFATLGPLAFPAVGAMLAVMASLGFGGGGSAGSLPASNQGKGTTLGASDAQSASIKNSIAALADIDRVTMTYSAQMAASLKSIENNIGGLASILVRTGNISGATAGIKTGTSSTTISKLLSVDPTGLLSKIPVIGGLVGAINGVIKTLFGSKTTIVGSGLFGGAQNLSSILSGGFDLQTYADIQKKKKFLGITTSTKYSTQYGAADPQVEAQFGLILKSFYDAIGAAAVPLGKSTSEIEKQLDSFVVNIGKIDFTGLSGDEIQKKLEAVFGAAADQMAASAFPGIEKFQKVGEGAFETLTRVASTVEGVTVDLGMLGKSAAGLGVDAKMSIAGLFDSVDAMNSATQAYFNTYYTEAEQAAVKTSQLTTAFSSLGLTLPDSIASYRALVDAQDLTTAAGQSTYAALIQLAPAFAQIATGAQDATSAAAIIRERQDLEKQLLELQGDTVAIRNLELQATDASNRSILQRIYDLKDEQAATAAAAQAAQDLANAQAQAAAEAAAAQKAVADERYGIEGQILELQGNTAEIRKRELDALDPSNRALMEQVYALNDAQAAAEAAAEAQQAAAQAAQEAAQAAQEAAQKTDQLRQAWSSIGETIETEIKRIRGLTGADGTQGFAQLMSQFNAATEAARHGDQAAAQSLPELSKALLDAAAQAATSQQELSRVQAATANSLQATYDLINAATMASQTATSGVLGPDTSTADASNWWNSYSPANDTSASEIRNLKAQVVSLQEDIRSGLAAIAGATNKTARILDDASSGELTLNTVAA